MEDIHCEYFEACPICGSSERIKLLWILAYCKTRRFEECARYRTRQSGDTPPFTLLPDGTHMDSQTEKLVREHVEACKQLEGRG